MAVSAALKLRFDHSDHLPAPFFLPSFTPLIFSFSPCRLCLLRLRRLFRLFHPRMCVNIHRYAGVLRPGGTAAFRVYIWDVYNMDCSGLILWDYYAAIIPESCALVPGIRLCLSKWNDSIYRHRNIRGTDQAGPD
jgi:hypothetical protein